MKRTICFATGAVCYLILLSLLAEASALAQSSEELVATTLTQIPISIHPCGAWKRAESANFRIWCQLTDQHALRLAETCEAWRQQLRSTWIADPTMKAWVPKCEVVVHPDQAHYNGALNLPGDRSVGSTRMKFDQEQVVFRRIDLRADACDWSTSALPHELTHVVLGERFGGRQLPRWADEGIAMLSESSEKHRERLANLREHLKTTTLFTLRELVQIQCVPEPTRRDSFYSQSLALSSLLIRKSTPAHFATFIDDSSQIGFDHALLKHYQLNGISALQREWDAWISQPVNMLPIQFPVEGTITAVLP